MSSIQASGVKEPVILRLREDGEYQLVAGYRRRRGSELAKKQDIPAFVYEMTLQEAVDYHRRVQNQPALPIPGKLVKPTVEKKTEQPAPAAVSIAAWYWGADPVCGDLCLFCLQACRLCDGKPSAGSRL